VTAKLSLIMMHFAIGNRIHNRNISTDHNSA